MCDYDYFLYKEMNRVLTKKDLDYMVEMSMTDNLLKKVCIWIKYKFKKSY